VKRFICCISVVFQFYFNCADTIRRIVSRSPQQNIRLHSHKFALKRESVSVCTSTVTTIAFHQFNILRICAPLNHHHTRLINDLSAASITNIIALFEITYCH